jgi:hypothetical protein
MGYAGRYEGMACSEPTTYPTLVIQGGAARPMRPILFLKGDDGVNVHIRDHMIQRFYDVRKRAGVPMVDGPSLASREISGHLVYPHEWELLQ